jgi:sugar (pentulose or hexulose) kinase
MKFKFAYVSLKDVAADLGGASGAAGGATKGLGVAFGLLFVADLVRMLRAKRSHEYNSFKCRQLQKRLPLYRATVDALLENLEIEERKQR